MALTYIAAWRCSELVVHLDTDLMTESSEIKTMASPSALSAHILTENHSLNSIEILHSSTRYFGGKVGLLLRRELLPYHERTLSDTIHSPGLFVANSDSQSDSISFNILRDFISCERDRSSNFSEV